METERYQAFYRRFRPETFSQVRGQEAIVTTLKNQVSSGRVGHAYLFTGTRGTGKTTAAKILARAVNCENPQEGDPCGECASCRRILAGSSLNVAEIDAASNNGVDSVRELIQEMAYPPAEGRYRVYIVDEVHMFSVNAFNALLKSLEEPPSYVIFILATTEPHKIPITILSRCQRFDFRRITREVISDQLSMITEKEGIPMEKRALDYLAGLGDGSMRDALSLLERCVNYHGGKSLTYEMVLEVLGSSDSSFSAGLFRAVCDGDAGECMKLLEKRLYAGGEIRQLVQDLLSWLRNLMLYLAAGENVREMIDLGEENYQQLKQDAVLTSLPELIRYIRILSALSDDLRFSTQKRVSLELALIRLCMPEMEQDGSGMAGRMRKLERRLAELEKAPRLPAGNRGMQTAAAQPENAAGDLPAKEKKALPPALPETVRKLAQDWDRVVEKLPTPLRHYMSRGTPGIDGTGQLTLALPEKSIELTALEKKKEEAEEELAVILGEKPALKLIALPEEKEPEGFTSLEEVKELILSAGGSLEGIEFTTEDETE